MKKIVHLCLAMALISVMSCKDDKKTTETEVETETTAKEKETKTTSNESVGENIKITVPLSPRSDSKVEGTIIFSQRNGLVTMIGSMKGLSEGMHAIHLHEKADCSSADGKSSGGHWNPTGQPHGAWGDKAGYHKGDIGNFEVKANGRGTISMNTDEWCIGCGDETKDILGKAVIVHQGEDDLKSQPSGEAGSRVSCGGIIQ